MGRFDPRHLIMSYEQIPQDKYCAERRRAVKHHLRCAPSLRCPLEFLVSAPDILRRVKRILYELFNVRRLYFEVACKGRLQLRDLNERFLGSADTLLVVAL